MVSQGALEQFQEGSRSQGRLRHIQGASLQVQIQFGRVRLPVCEVSLVEDHNSRLYSGISPEAGKFWIHGLRLSVNNMMLAHIVTDGRVN